MANGVTSRLATLQKANPAFCLLKIIQALVCAGAKSLHVTINEHRVEISGWLLDNPESLEMKPASLPSLALGEDSDPASHLAVGLLASPQTGQEIELFPGRELRGLRFQKGSWCEMSSGSEESRFALLRTTDNQSSKAELEAIQARCQWSPIPIWLNGKLVQGKWTSNGYLGLRKLVEPSLGTAGVCVASYKAWGMNRTRVMQLEESQGGQPKEPRELVGSFQAGTFLDDKRPIREPICRAVLLYGEIFSAE